MLYDKLTAIRMQLQDDLLEELVPEDESAAIECEGIERSTFVRWTRSRGNVPVLPNVQPAVLERKKRSDAKS